MQDTVRCRCHLYARAPIGGCERKPLIGRRLRPRVREGMRFPTAFESCFDEHNSFMAKRLVFLVPGFFGFTSVGAVSYFEDVERSLGRALRQRGFDARIVRCMTQPTASITRRADALRKQVLRSGGLKARELHFVGHSTGGLDVRMLLTPGVKIARGDSEERIARLTRTAISVATPHHGTPLANHFLTVQGQTLLLVLSALATSGRGRGTILAAAKALGLIARLDDWLGRTQT